MRTVGPWKPTPLWLRWLGKQEYRRLWEWAHIGGFFSEWEYADRSALASPDAMEG